MEGLSPSPALAAKGTDPRARPSGKMISPIIASQAGDSPTSGVNTILAPWALPREKRRRARPGCLRGAAEEVEAAQRDGGKTVPGLGIMGV